MCALICEERLDHYQSRHVPKGHGSEDWDGDTQATLPQPLVDGFDLGNRLKDGIFLVSHFEWSNFPKHEEENRLSLEQVWK